MSQPSKTKKTTREKRLSPPITRQRSKHSFNLQIASQSKKQSQPGPSQIDSSPSSSFLYQPASQRSQQSQRNLQLQLTIPEQSTMERTTQSSRSDENLLEESMQTEQSPVDLSDSIGKINLSGILNKTLEGTSEMLKLLEEEEATTTNHNAIPATGQSYFDEKFKKVKSSLIILAKASHHRTFMETCLKEKTHLETCGCGLNLTSTTRQERLRGSGTHNSISQTPSHPNQTLYKSHRGGKTSS